MSGPPDVHGATRTRLKVCCIASREEAGLAIDRGADALGLVSAMPSGPGVVDEATIAAVVAAVPPPVATFLLTSRVDAAGIVAQLDRSGASTLQLVDAVAAGELAALRAENVADAVRAVRPFGVDVCSGVRTDGRLDPAKLTAFTAELARA